MKRQIGISIILAILVIALAWLYIKFSNDTQLNDKGVLTKENEAATEHSLAISQTYVSYPYYIKDDDGRLVVYEAKTQNVFAQTGIETDSLPKEIQLHLDAGIFFETEEDLYNFLESYSS